MCIIRQLVCISLFVLINDTCARPHAVCFGNLGITESWDLGIRTSWALGIMEPWNLGFFFQGEFAPCSIKNGLYRQHHCARNGDASTPAWARHPARPGRETAKQTHTHTHTHTHKRKNTNCIPKQRFHKQSNLFQGALGTNLCPNCVRDACSLGAWKSKPPRSRSLGPKNTKRKQKEPPSEPQRGLPGTILGSPQGLGTPNDLESWSHGILEPWSHASWNHRNMEPWIRGIIEEWNHGILKSWNHGIIESWTWKHGIMKSWKHAIFESWNHATMGSLTHASWNHGFVESSKNGIMDS
jgi:hypothetical protein